MHDFLVFFLSNRMIYLSLQKEQNIKAVQGKSDNDRSDLHDLDGKVNTENPSFCLSC